MMDGVGEYFHFAQELSHPSPVFRYFKINNSYSFVSVHIVLNKPLALFSTNCLCPPKKSDLKSERQFRGLDVLRKGKIH